MMARVSGMVTRMTVPWPSVDVRSTLPPIFSMLVRTTSMPTPRPDTLVTASAVEKPGRKTRSRTARRLMAASSSGVTRPFSTALRPTRAGSMPAPSSAISMTTWPDSWYARRVSVPRRGLPAASRASGVSMPWSTELRTTWVSGSLTASSRVRSSSVSRPCMTRSTSLPHWADRSRTTRGSLAHR